MTEFICHCRSAYLPSFPLLFGVVLKVLSNVYKKCNEKLYLIPRNKDLQMGTSQDLVTQKTH